MSVNSEMIHMVAGLRSHCCGKLSVRVQFDNYLVDSKLQILLTRWETCSTLMDQLQLTHLTPSIKHERTSDFKRHIKAGNTTEEYDPLMTIASQKSHCS